MAAEITMPSQVEKLNLVGRVNAIKDARMPLVRRRFSNRDGDVRDLIQRSILLRKDSLHNERSV